MQNWLIYWLTKSYLEPNTNRYKIFSFLNRYPYLIIISVFLIVILYPTIRLGYLYTQNNYDYKNLSEIKQELFNKQKLFTTIEQRQIEQYQKSKQFAEFDLSIKNVLKQYEVEINYLQWYFEPYKRIEIGLNGYSSDIFKILNNLHQLDDIFIQEVNINKLYQDKKVQMNAHFIIQE